MPQPLPANAPDRKPDAGLPPSAVPSAAGWIGGASLVAALAWMAASGISNPVTALVLGALAYSIPALLCEIAVRPRSMQWQRAFARPTLARTGEKLIALAAIYLLLGLAYGFFPIYSGTRTLFAALAPLAPAFALACAAYVWLTDISMQEPEDGYARLGRMILRLRLEPSAWLGQLLLGWVVKGFFLPLMAGFAIKNMSVFLGPALADLAAPGSAGFFRALLNFLFLVDVIAGMVGYVLTLKLYGTEIRSTDATAAGWLSAVMCYPPFWPILSASYLNHDDGMDWVSWLGSSPLLMSAWGSAIVALIVIYVWATIAFGIRFSNLTHRGIITHGPYRYSKHPAYIAKNISWWLMSMPFLSQMGWLSALGSCAALAGVNVIYFIRAKTEERHLMQDADYRAYAEWMARNGLFARLRIARPGLTRA